MTLNQTIDKKILKKILLSILIFDVILKNTVVFVFPQLLKIFIWTIELLLCALLLIPDVFDKNIKVSNKLIFSLLILLCAVNTYFTHNTYLLFTLLVCWIIRNDDLKEVFKYILINTFISVSIVIIYYLVSTYIIGSNRFVFNSSIRYTLGFIHPNTLSIRFSNIIILYLYVSFKDKKIIKYIVSLIITIIIYLLSSSETGLIISLFSIILFGIVEREIILINNLVKKVGLFIFPLTCALFLLLVLFYHNGNDFAIFVNNILTNRIYLTEVAFNKCNITLLGQMINYDLILDGAYFYLDSLFSFLLFQFGLLWIIIISFIFIKINSKCNVCDCILIIIFSLFAVSESIGISFIMLCPILLIKKLFSENETIAE